MTARLVVRGHLQANESLAGYVIRLGQANGLRGHGQLLHRVGLTPGFDARTADLGRLASLACTDLSDLQKASLAPLAAAPRRQSFNGAPITRAHLLTTGARSCPACIEEKGYASRLWHLRAYAACHLHGAVLTDQCPQCKGPLSWGRTSLHECFCGAEITMGRPAPKDIVQLSTLLALAADDAAPAMFGPSPIAGVSSLAWFFGASFVGSARERRAVFASSASVDAALPILEQGAWFALDWRASFANWALDRFHRPEARVGLHREFGPELVRLRATFEETCPFVIDDLRRFFSENWQGFMLRRQSYFCIGPRVPRFITATKAARLLGISKVRVDEFIQSGQIVGVESLSGKRQYRAIRSDGVEALRRHLATLLTAEEAAVALGISSCRFRQLDRGGFIAAALAISQVQRYDVKHLQDFCLSLASKHSSATAPSIRLTDVRTRSLLDLIKHIQAGDLCAWFGRDATSSLSNLYVNPREVEALGRIKCLRGRGDTISAQKATRLLKLGHPTLSALVRQEQIDAVWSRGRLLSVSSAYVENLAATIVTSAAIAADCGLAAVAITRRLQQLGIRPVLAAAPARKVAAIWRREDITGIDFSTQWRTPCGRPSTPSSTATTILLRRSPGPSTPSDCVSLADMSKRLLIDRETIRHLALNGFLEAPAERTRANHLRGVTRCSADIFEQTYISSSEIALQYGLKGSAVTRRLLSLGVKPILEATVSARVQLCWRREDLEGVDFSSQYITPCGRPSAPALDGRTKLLEPRPRGSSRLTADAIHVHTATGLLGTNSCSLRAAVKTGYVRAVSQSVAGKILTVSETDVAAFAARYVFTPKLASESGLSATSVVRGLAKLGVEPVFKGKRPVHTLWDRSTFDLEDLLVRWTTASGELSQQSSLLPF